MSRWESATLAVVVGFGAWLPNAHAGGAPRVTWAGPDACPSAEAAQARIVEEIGAGSSLEIDVAIEEPATNAPFVANVSIRAPQGDTQRTLESPDCSTLLDAVALISGAAGAELQPEVEPQPEPEPSTIPLPAQPPEEKPRARPTTPGLNSRPPLPVPDPIRGKPPRVGLAAHLRIEGILGWGVTPGIDGGGGGAIGLTAGRFRAEAFAHALAPRAARFAIEALRVEIRAWSVGARGCAIAGWTARDRVFFPLCAAVEAGVMQGDGEGTSLVASDNFSAPWAALRVGPSVFIRATSWLSIGVMLEARAVVLRPVFGVGGSTERFQSAVIGPLGSLGAEFHFPRRKPGTAGK